MRENPKQKMRIWAMLCHLSALLWVPLVSLLFLGIPLYLPFLSTLGPLIIWRWKKTLDPWIDFQGREALNFQLSLSIYALIVIVLSLVMVVMTFSIALTTNLTTRQINTIFNVLVTFLITLISVLMIAQSVLVGFAAVKAYKGQHYRYPFTIRFLR